MNSKFKNKKFRKDNSRPRDNSKPRELGKFIHMCEDDVVVRISHGDIPFPNALVLNSDHKPIGKVEEVLGPQHEVYASIKLDSLKETYDETSVFYCYENKFIPKDRFMVRSEVEKKKEEGDKKKEHKRRDGGDSNFKKRDGGLKRRDGDFKRRDGDFKRRDGDFKRRDGGDFKKRFKSKR